MTSATNRRSVLSQDVGEVVVAEVVGATATTVTKRDTSVGTVHSQDRKAIGVAEAVVEGVVHVTTVTKWDTSPVIVLIPNGRGTRVWDVEVVEAETEHVTSVIRLATLPGTVPTVEMVATQTLDAEGTHLGEAVVAEDHTEGVVTGEVTVERVQEMAASSADSRDTSHGSVRRAMFASDASSRDT